MRNTDLLFEGAVLFDRLDSANQSTGLRPLGSTDKLSITQNSEIKRATTKERGNYGQTTASAVIPQPTEVSLVLKNLEPANLAMAVLGDVSDYSQGDGTFTDQPVTAKLGRYVEIGFRSIAANSDVVTNADGTKTYVRGTDYEINHRHGWLMPLAGGAINADEELKVSGSYGSVAAKKIQAGTETILRGKLVLDGRNLMTGEEALVTLKRVTLSSNGEIDFLSADPITATFSGTLETPGAGDAPMEILYGIQS